MALPIPPSEEFPESQIRTQQQKNRALCLLARFNPTPLLQSSACSSTLQCSTHSLADTGQLEATLPRMEYHDNTHPPFANRM